MDPAAHAVLTALWRSAECDAEGRDPSMDLAASARAANRAAETAYTRAHAAAPCWHADWWNWAAGWALAICR